VPRLSGEARRGRGPRDVTSPPPDFTPVGIAVGHSTNRAGATGLTVVRPVDGHYRGGVAVIGRASGTRELHALAPDHLADRVDAILLTGGSAYGLDAAAGVMHWLEQRGRGVAIGGGVVPIVPAAVIFDLAPLGRFDARPTAEMAYDACDIAVPAGIEEGSVGAGTGATVGKLLGPAHAMKGGVGCALSSSGDVSVAAIAVVNAVGDVRDASGAIIAGARRDGAFVNSARLFSTGVTRGQSDVSAGRAVAATALELQHTTIAVVATNVALSRVDLTQVARAATAALYGRITPAGTSLDGDVIFALAPARGTIEGAPMIQIESLAVLALEEAIERAVRLARGRDGIPGLADAD
jgi:L-aminopeptidase/D-esterase-like protein